ncbi:MAG: histone deacetylase family protein [Alphaproteobacteria bacterium]|nr:histone deacetylase family protein [Alphaproteobacteria bacterium]NNF23679.1 histone deacetylase family protein [Paracoccaceae bacterium]
MTTGLYTHQDCLAHVTPPGHPEQVARLEAIAAALSGAAFGALDRRAAPLGDLAEVLALHDADYVKMVQELAPADGIVSLDADTYMSPGSVTAALRAAGGCCAAVDAVMAGEIANAFVACRPPGHHAERGTSMGFCLFGNAAIAANHALEAHGLERVAILDFDVHHGNGTQDLLWDEPRTLFVSSHQMPLWPGTGDVHETGAHDNVMNVPLAPGTGGAEMRRVYEAQVLPAVADYEPQLVIVSAGFDAHRADPLANLNWDTEDFAWLSREICQLAARASAGRVVSTLEGGYDLTALGESVAAHVGVLMEAGA